MSTSAPRPDPGDQSTRNLVSRDGLRHTLFVEAGAGTGKTRQLIERIVNLVLQECVRLANIAAITFTDAAAAELAIRLRVRFEQGADTAEGTDRQICLDALADLDLASISTLHGFARSLLHEFALDAGAPPALEVLDEVSSQVARTERWTRLVDELHEDPSHEEVLVRAALLDVPLEARYQGQATLRDIAAKLNDNWDRLDQIAGTEPPPMGPVDFRAFDAAVAAVTALPDQCTDPGDLFHRRLTSVLIPEMVAVAVIDDPERKVRAIARRDPSGWSAGRGGKSAAWPGGVKAAKNLVGDVNDAVAAVVATAADEVLRHLLVLITREVLGAADDRRRHGRLEFHDLLVLARRLLRSSPRARGVLHKRYTHLLLDEFQDTDPIQIELAALIATSFTGTDPPPWPDLDVDDGRLFFVGDPKQSIYRFRRADIGLFLAVRDRFTRNGASQQLTTNFRTVGPILDWVNSYFTTAMPTEVPGRQPRYEPLRPARSPNLDTDHRPALLGGPHPDPRVHVDELRTLEADDIATIVAEIRDRPDQWRVLDQTTGEWRPAQLADVTVLVPTRASVPYLRQAFDNLDIPYRLGTGTLIYDTQEVRDILAVLAAIDDPSDEIALVAALRSPLYACSDVDLLTYHHAGGRWSLHRRRPDTLDDDHPVVAALAHLRTLQHDRWCLSTSELVDRIVRERHAHLLALGHRRPTEIWRCLRFLQDQARAFDTSGGGDLRTFLDWTTLQADDGTTIQEPLLAETDNDSIQILTVHAAKGLEFPITILSGLNMPSTPRRSGVSLLWGDDGQPELRLRRGLATAGHKSRADLDAEMDGHEQLRLLYVAATRARDHLIVSCHHKAKTDTHATRLWDHFAQHNDLWRSAPCRQTTPPVEAPAMNTTTAATTTTTTTTAAAYGRSDGQRDAWIARREAILAPHRAARVVAATALIATTAGTIHHEALDHPDPVDRHTLQQRTAPPRPARREGSAIGRAVHATLQIVDLADPRHVDTHVQHHCDLEAIPELAATVAKLVRSALGSRTVRLAATNTYHREVHVAVPVGNRVIEGYIDLLIRTPTGLIIVDYKTDSVRTDADVDARLATYTPQGAAYALALERATGLDVIDCRFVFCQRGDAIERSINDLPAATHLVGTRLATIATT